ncbi:hypothetical protein BH09BAC3_BH09BAC3_24180 [soil metagenome]
MKDIFKNGDVKVFKKMITEADQAIFNNELLHPVCSTFALARDFEWSSRLFFIELKDANEEGVGTFLHIDHKSPAFVGEEIEFRAIVESINGPNMTCYIEARVGERLIAVGKTGQKMLTRDKLKVIFTKT